MARGCAIGSAAARLVSHSQGIAMMTYTKSGIQRWLACAFEFCACISLASSLVAGAAAQDIGSREPRSGEEMHGAAVVLEDGTIQAKDVQLPLSDFASVEAQDALRSAVLKPNPPTDAAIDILRKIHGQSSQALSDRMQRLFPVTIERQTIGGVRTEIITPRQGVAPRNSDRILINLRGGGFMWGDGAGGEVESIPIASVGRVRVVTVNFRMAPENRFPAASEDVAAVYQELLKRYKPQMIGIYGCSSGGLLTAEAIAWFVKVGLPLPGAIGTFCGSASPPSGDSAHLTLALTGKRFAQFMPQSHGKAPAEIFFSLPYFAGANAADPLVFPINSPQLLAKFPPTLLIAGSRDFWLSSLFNTQRQLTNAGVQAELHVWDGLWHAFLMNPDLPESKEAYIVIATFFDRHLGHS
jgi:acetyl esterase/lipase